MSSRDRILDAYADLLAEEGERFATVDAVAARAGVSKGGVLYHFPSKDQLAAAVCDRLAVLAAEDAEVPVVEVAPAPADDTPFVEWQLDQLAELAEALGEE